MLYVLLLIPFQCLPFCLIVCHVFLPVCLSAIPPSLSICMLVFLLLMPFQLSAFLPDSLPCLFACLLVRSSPIPDCLHAGGLTSNAHAVVYLSAEKSALSLRLSVSLLVFYSRSVCILEVIMSNFLPYSTDHMFKDIDAHCNKLSFF